MKGELMTQKEFEKRKRAIEDYRKEVVSSKSHSRRFLKKFGVVTKKGKLTKEFKALCIQQEAA